MNRPGRASELGDGALEVSPGVGADKRREDSSLQSVPKAAISIVERISVQYELIHW